MSNSKKMSNELRYLKVHINSKNETQAEVFGVSTVENNNITIHNVENGNVTVTINIPGIYLINNMDVLSDSNSINYQINDEKDVHSVLFKDELVIKFFNDGLSDISISFRLNTSISLENKYYVEQERLVNKQLKEKGNELIRTKAHVDYMIAKEREHLSIIDENAKTISIYENELKSKDEELKNDKSKIDLLETRLKKQETELISKISEIKTIKTIFEEQLNNKEERLKRIEKKDAEIKKKLKVKDAEINQKLAELGGLKIALEASEIKLKEQQDEIDNKNVIIKDKEQQIINKNGHIEQLLESERQYVNIYNSKAVRIVRKWWSFKNWLFPQGSKRKFVAKLIKKFIQHPLYMIKKLNLDRIKRTIKYMRNESGESLENRLDLATVTISQADGIEREKLELIPLNNSMVNIDEIAKLVVPSFDHIEVSIVIPVYNQINYTYNCIKSIIDNTEEVSYEIIVADDCSTDLTKDIKKFIDNITVVKTKENVRFLRNCNNAAQYARGEYILFLNNDTQVLKEWLSSLVNLIKKDNQIGMVGSKLLYPDGTLQEAGGIIWGNGNAWNYGNSQSPMKPEFNYVKEVDYISGAAIMIRKELWKEIGGFDELFNPAYCEDSDLAFEVRKHGMKVVYQPLSKVVHFEGKSNGTDLSSGVKKYQVDNMIKLQKKWKNEYKLQSRDESDVFHARDRSQGKETILIIDHYVPMYDKDAGSRTIWQYIHMFIAKGYNVKFISDNFYPHEPYTTDLEQLGVEVLYGTWYMKNWKQWIIDNKDNIDYCFLNRPHITEKYIDFIKNNTKAKCIYYGCDLHCLRLEREYEITGDIKYKKEAEDWEKREYSLMKKMDMNYYPSTVEIDRIHDVDPTIPAKRFDIYVYNSFINKINTDFKKRKDLMFVGGFTHQPNEDAVVWFAEKIFPIIRKELDVKFYIIGSNPTENVKKLANENIILKGFVSDEELIKLYNECRLVVVPLRFGAGVKGKVIEALYYGTPMVTTDIGIEGIPDIDNIIAVENDANSFAKRVIDEYNNPKKLKKTALLYQKYVKKHCSIEAVWNNIADDFSKEEGVK